MRLELHQHFQEQNSKFSDLPYHANYHACSDNFCGFPRGMVTEPACFLQVSQVSQVSKAASGCTDERQPQPFGPLHTLHPSVPHCTPLHRMIPNYTLLSPFGLGRFFAPVRPACRLRASKRTHTHTDTHTRAQKPGMLSEMNPICETSCGGFQCSESRRQGGLHGPTRQLVHWHQAQQNEALAHKLKSVMAARLEAM